MTHFFKNEPNILSTTWIIYMSINGINTADTHKILRNSVELNMTHVSGNILHLYEALTWTAGIPTNPPGFSNVRLSIKRWLHLSKCISPDAPHTATCSLIESMSSAYIHGHREYIRHVYTKYRISSPYDAYHFHLNYMDLADFIMRFNGHTKGTVHFIRRLLDFHNIRLYHDTYFLSTHQANALIHRSLETPTKNTRFLAYYLNLNDTYITSQLYSSFMINLYANMSNYIDGYPMLIDTNFPYPLFPKYRSLPESIRTSFINYIKVFSRILMPINIHQSSQQLGYVASMLGESLIDILFKIDDIKLFKYLDRLNYKLCSRYARTFKPPRNINYTPFDKFTSSPISTLTYNRDPSRRVNDYITFLLPLPSPFLSCYDGFHRKSSSVFIYLIKYIRRHGLRDPNSPIYENYKRIIRRTFARALKTYPDEIHPEDLIITLPYITLDEPLIKTLDALTSVDRELVCMYGLDEGDVSNSRTAHDVIRYSGSNRFIFNAKYFGHGIRRMSRLGFMRQFGFQIGIIATCIIYAAYRNPLYTALVCICAPPLFIYNYWYIRHFAVKWGVSTLFTGAHICQKISSLWTTIRNAYQNIRDPFNSYPMYYTQDFS